jgi:hypothetical protein
VVIGECLGVTFRAVLGKLLIIPVLILLVSHLILLAIQQMVLLKMHLVNLLQLLVSHLEFDLELDVVLVRYMVIHLIMQLNSWSRRQRSGQRYNGVLDVGRENVESLIITLGAYLGDTVSDAVGVVAIDAIDAAGNAACDVFGKIFDCLCCSS